jgi:uncharacterized protein (TIGR02466 family)
VAVITTGSMNIQSVNIMPLFPTPVLVYEVEIEEKEKLFLLSQYPDNVTANQGNLTSTDNSILKNSELQRLNEMLLFYVNDAFTRIHNPRQECELYITQSWLNFSSENQYHHEHTHKNSFYSAVLYLQVTEEDNITLYHPTYDNRYEIYSNHYDLYNSSSWQVPVKDNMLLIFPSSLPHSVPSVKHNNMRVSLSFNTFLRGEFGDPSNLNYLKL